MVQAAKVKATQVKVKGCKGQGRKSKSQGQVKIVGGVFYPIDLLEVRHARAGVSKEMLRSQLVQENLKGPLSCGMHR